MAEKAKHIEKSYRNSYFAVVLLLTAATRFYKIAEPDHVCWDETHFGKMGSWYINRTFFFDVHPPLGKMLIGLSGYLTGYDGTFPFEKPGDKYENTSYIGMRIFCAGMGSLIVPMTFLIVDQMTNSPTAALFSSLLILFDVGLITLSQYILLDPILLCFMTGSILGAIKVSYNKNPEFSLKWWLWLVFTGIMLACCSSVKFVGLFVVGLIGLVTLADLWEILGDMDRPLDYLKIIEFVIFIPNGRADLPVPIMEELDIDNSRAALAVPMVKKSADILMFPIPRIADSFVWK